MTLLLLSPCFSSWAIQELVQNDSAFVKNIRESQLTNGPQQMFGSNWKSKTCVNFDPAFTKLQPIVRWQAVDIKTNGPISVKCLMTEARGVRHVWWWGGQTHVVALDKRLWKKAYLWVLCGRGTSPPAEKRKQVGLLQQSHENFNHKSLLQRTLSELDHDWQVYRSMKPVSRMWISVIM